MPEFTIEKSLQEVTQIQHTEQDLRDLKGVGLQDTVNNMSVRDLLRESEHLKQRVMPGQCEELEAKVDATVETARQLGDKATEIIDEVGVENLDPDTVEKLVGVLNLSPEQRQELLQGIEQGSDEAVATFQAMLEEAIEDGADPEVAYAIAAVLLDDPNIPAHVKEELRQLAKELVEHIKELRDLLEDALLREALKDSQPFGQEIRQAKKTTRCYDSSWRMIHTSGALSLQSISMMLLRERPSKRMRRIFQSRWLLSERSSVLRKLQKMSMKRFLLYDKISS